MILAIDPGPERSALVVLDGATVRHAIIEPNPFICGVLRTWPASVDVLVMEQIESMGMAVGASVFEAVFWTGRFSAVWESAPIDPDAWDARVLRLMRPWHRLTRRAVKLHLCGTSRAKDGNVRQALIDRYGGQAAKGTKKAPGPLYGIASHCWAALAVAVTYRDLDGDATLGQGRQAAGAVRGVGVTDPNGAGSPESL